MGEPAPVPPRRRNRELPGWVSLTVIAVFLAGVGGLYYAAGLPKNGIRVEHLETDARGTLPKGSSPDEIRAWLTAKGITEIGSLSDPGGKQIGVHALVPNDSWIDRAEIDLRFLLDADGKLRELKFARYRTFQPDTP